LPWFVHGTSYRSLSKKKEPDSLVPENTRLDPLLRVQVTSYSYWSEPSGRTSSTSGSDSGAVALTVALRRTVRVLSNSWFEILTSTARTFFARRSAASPSSRTTWRWNGAASTITASSVSLQGVS